jgi:hypothetical protein
LDYHVYTIAERRKNMESTITNEELCDALLDIMALRDLAGFIHANADETVDKDIFRVYESALDAVSEKMKKHLE